MTSIAASKHEGGRAIEFLTGVQLLIGILGTRVRGSLEWVKVREQHDGKPKLMKHVAYPTTLNVMGCGAGECFGLFIWRCRTLGLIG